MHMNHKVSKRALDILLVNPRWRGFGNRKKIKVSERRVHPLSLGIVAAIIRRHNPAHNIRIVDQANAQIPYDDSYDLVGITVNTYTAEEAKNIAETFRELAVPVLMGGVHATLLPDDCLKYADAVLVGEAELVLPEILNDLIAGKMAGVYEAETIEDLSVVPIPDRSLFTFKRANAAFIQATRGCTNVCRFCYLQYVNWGPHRARPVNSVLEELSTIKEDVVLFVDDNMFIDRDWGLELFGRMKGMGKFWWAQAPTTLANDDELLKAAAESGCFSLSYGFQSVNPSSLSGDRVLQNRIDSYKMVVEKSQQLGILVDGTFIFGFDSDDRKVFLATEKMIREINLDTYTFYLLTVYPGTPYYNKLEAEGRIITRDIGKYDWDHAVIEPKKMPPSELEEGVRWLYGELDRHYRRHFLGKASQNVGMLFKSVNLAKFLLSSGYPRPYNISY